MNNLSENIVKQRHTLHLTQEKLAERAGLSVNFLSKLERGTSRTVSAETLQRLANALKISMEELLTGGEQEQREEICKGLITIPKAQDNNK